MLGFPKQFAAVNIKIRDQLKNRPIGQRTDFMVKRTFSSIYFSGRAIIALFKMTFDCIFDTFIHKFGLHKIKRNRCLS
ncbi:hypothetical protein LH29_05775 [Draconibacterium sediminis]|uniref:Transposase DDE domain-containing protein n=1 Tax=Draconibacterium sediminis TaxID=1544798 RepID=A0A0D8JEH0_9BACT|nr:hypothetical protein LH29_05775 [Draconibacterium sediminis]